MKDFISFIAGLAPEGETALAGYQKPVRRNGEAVLHADGTPKYTWPPFLPTRPIKPGSAVYMNTGSFILDRLGDNISAGQANCEFVLCMMLDDIGTKAATPPLDPTWIMETSEGSFQWGYVFSEQPSKGEFTAAIKAIAAAGYTDPGATNAVRWFRIPGSVNLKPDRDGFAARLVEFHPERAFTLEGICEALEVTPAAADTATRQSLRIEDTGDDTVLAWLSEQGMVLSRTNAQGWLSIVCPNKAQHSDGTIEARYKPLERSFCCYHGHCEDMNSTTFLEWVSANGGPMAKPGLRDDLLAQHMARMQEAIAGPSTFFKEDATDVIADVERRELGRLEKSGWYKRFAYVEQDDSFFDLVDRREVSRRAFNALYRHLKCVSVHGGRRIEASVSFDENRTAMGAPTVAGITYAAGEGAVVAFGGYARGNKWVDARPELKPGGDPTPWLDHCRRMVPDEALLNHIWDVMAFKYQHPEIKVNHAILHGGDEGCGKDSMWAPFMWSICGPHMRNRGMVDNDSLSAAFGYHLESEILLLNELREPDAGARRALANRLKPIIAAPPETLPVNRKHFHPYDMANRLFVLAFSNDPVPISLSSQDRRWCCVWSHAPRMTPEEGAALWSWFREGGLHAAGSWLKARDVRAFNPGAAPPWTDFKATLVEQGMSMAEAILLDEIRERRGTFARGVICSPLHKVCDLESQRLNNSLNVPVKIPVVALLHALKEAGWADLGWVSSRGATSKKQVIAAPDLVDRLSRSALRRLAETGVDESGVVDLAGVRASG